MNSYSRQRETSAPITEWNGFSVVAPISVTRPDSTTGRSASCWALLKRWISSMKSTVRWPLRAEALARAHDHGLHVGLARRDGRELLEDRLRAGGDDARERRLAGAGRAEEERGRDAVLLDRAAQRRALADELRLAGELVERARAQAVGERRVRRAPLLGRVVEQAHDRDCMRVRALVVLVLEQAELAGATRRVDARAAAEGDQRVADVHVDRTHREVQLGRDLAVRAAVRHAPDAPAAGVA